MKRPAPVLPRGLRRRSRKPRQARRSSRNEIAPDRLTTRKRNPGKDRWRPTGVCARGSSTMEIGWMTPTELFFLLIAALPSIMLIVVLAWRDRVQERGRWKRRGGNTFEGGRNTGFTESILPALQLRQSGVRFRGFHIADHAADSTANTRLVLEPSRPHRDSRQMRPAAEGDFRSMVYLTVRENSVAADLSEGVE